MLVVMLSAKWYSYFCLSGTTDLNLRCLDAFKLRERLAYTSTLKSTICIRVCALHLEYFGVPVAISAPSVRHADKLHSLFSTSTRSLARLTLNLALHISITIRLILIPPRYP